MSASNPARTNADSTGADTEGLLLKRQLRADVVGKFRAATVFWDTMRWESPGPDGVTFQFVRDGDSQSDEHVPGTELLGNAFATAEGLVTMDAPIISHHDLPNVDLEDAHFAVTPGMIESMAFDLAKKCDQRAAQKAILGARTAALSVTAADGSSHSIHPGGQQVEESGATEAAAYTVDATGAKKFRDNVWELAEKWDEDDVPDDGTRRVYIRPRMVKVLGQDDRVWDRDYSGGSEFDFATRSMGRIGNVWVMKSNHVPSTNITTGPTKYQGDFSTTVAVGLHGTEGLVGVKRRDIRFYVGPDERRETVFTKASVRCGFGHYREESCAEIKVSGS